MRTREKRSIIRGRRQPEEEEEEVAMVEEEEEVAVEDAPEGEETEGGDETEAEAPRRPKGKGWMRSRVTWDLCWAWYWALPEVQQTRIARMGFGHILSVRPFHVDVPYLEALRERVCGREERLIRSILLGSLSEAVGLRGRRRGPLESLDEFCTGVRGALDLGDRSEERSIRIFISYLLGRLLFATQSSQMNCKFVLLLRDLEQAGRYAWGGFTPFLQIWGYTHFPMGRGIQVEGRQTMVPLMTRWEVAPDPRVTDRRAGDVRVALDHYPHEQVLWTPYAGEADASHPAVAAGQPLFDGHLLLLCLGTCEVLYLELVVRTLGWHQLAIEVPSLGREGHSRRRFFAEDRDWGADHGSTVAYWREGGEQVVRQTALLDSSAYMEDYQAQYAGHLRLDRRVMPESQAIRLLEGRLAEQEVELTRLWAEVRTLRAEQQRVRASHDTGASSSAQPTRGDLAAANRMQTSMEVDANLGQRPGGLPPTSSRRPSMLPSTWDPRLVNKWSNEA
ncbi:hypothetical protein Taro_030011 [Colocasia esculenta]|uniref:Aminotransferase-like plant mobile domain-containing protein n=1 Tax=Colocasia esculenta TaxID=4460 RepID=A0A843VF88_COLES|nr:hypothetical protein [Colocasia esculenta]